MNNSNRNFRQNKLHFSNIKIYNQFTNPVYSVFQVQFKYSSQHYLLPQIRCLITLRIECSIISIDSNIENKTISKVINIQQEKYRTKNGAQKNSSINWIILGRFPLPEPPFKLKEHKLSQRNCQIKLSLPRILHIPREYQESLIQTRISSKIIRMKTLNIGKIVCGSCVIHTYLDYTLLILWPFH